MTIAETTSTCVRVTRSFSVSGPPSSGCRILQLEQKHQRKLSAKRKLTNMQENIKGYILLSFQHFCKSRLN